MSNKQYSAMHHCDLSIPHRMSSQSPSLRTLPPSPPGRPATTLAVGVARHSLTGRPRFSLPPPPILGSMATASQGSTTSTTQTAGLDMETKVQQPSADANLCFPAGYDHAEFQRRLDECRARYVEGKRLNNKWNTQAAQNQKGKTTVLGNSLMENSLALRRGHLKVPSSLSLDLGGHCNGPISPHTWPAAGYMSGGASSGNIPLSPAPTPSLSPSSLLSAMSTLELSDTDSTSNVTRNSVGERKCDQPFKVSPLACGINPTDELADGLFAGPETAHDTFLAFIGAHSWTEKELHQAFDMLGEAWEAQINASRATSGSSTFSYPTTRSGSSSVTGRLPFKSTALADTSTSSASRPTYRSHENHGMQHTAIEGPTAVDMAEKYRTPMESRAKPRGKKNPNQVEHHGVVRHPHAYAVPVYDVAPRLASGFHDSVELSTSALTSKHLAERSLVAFTAAAQFLAQSCQTRHRLEMRQLLLSTEFTAKQWLVTRGVEEIHALQWCLVDGKDVGIPARLRILLPQDLQDTVRKEEDDLHYGNHNNGNVSEENRAYWLPSEVIPQAWLQWVPRGGLWNEDMRKSGPDNGAGKGSVIVGLARHSIGWEHRQLATAKRSKWLKFPAPLPPMWRYLVSKKHFQTTTLGAINSADASHADRLRRIVYDVSDTVNRAEETYQQLSNDIAVLELEIDKLRRKCETETRKLTELVSKGYRF